MPTAPLPERLLQVVIARARAAAPRECCGLLVETTDRTLTAIPLANVADTADAFAFSPLTEASVERRLRRRGQRRAGIYHSHPAGRPHPSRRDRDLLWAEHAGWQLIVTPGGAWALWQPTRGPWRLLAEGTA